MEKLHAIFVHPFVCQENFFKKLRHIPFPVLGDDGHYLPFAEVFTSEKGNTEEYRPSYKGHTQPLPKKSCRTMLQCSECKLWRLIFSKYKLKKVERDQLEVLLINIMYTCGATLKVLDLPAVYEFVHVRDPDCIDHIEKLYYSAGSIPIMCILCQ